MTEPEQMGLAAAKMPPGQHRVDVPPVMHYGRIPDRDPSSWTFTVGGATCAGSEQVYSLEQILGLPSAELTCDMHCATGWSALDIAWSGVWVKDLMKQAPPASSAVAALVFAEFGYAANVELDDLERALLVTHRNGEPLTDERGGPLRMVIPHLYTWKGPKWVRGWNYLRAADSDRGFWEQRGYHLRGDAWGEQRFAQRTQPQRGADSNHAEHDR